MAYSDQTNQTKLDKVENKGVEQAQISAGPEAPEVGEVISRVGKNLEKAEAVSKSLSEVIKMRKQRIKQSMAKQKKTQVKGQKQKKKGEPTTYSDMNFGYFKYGVRKTARLVRRDIAEAVIWFRDLRQDYQQWKQVKKNGKNSLQSVAIFIKLFLFI